MPEHLRAEVRRLHLTMRTTLDPVTRRTLAERATYLAQEAEIIADLPDGAEGLYVTIAHYQYMLAHAENPGKQRVLVHVLQRAENKLQQVSDQQRSLKRHRLAVA